MFRIRKCTIVAVRRTAALAVTFLLLGTQPALATASGPPPPPAQIPPPPCISTGVLFPAASSDSYLCSVRNVGIATHNVTFDLRDTHNSSVATGTFHLDSGATAGGAAPFIFGGGACVVTTDEGTKDALNDLAVVLQLVLNSDGVTVGETEGKIFEKCAASNGPPPPP